LRDFRAKRFIINRLCWRLYGCEFEPFSGVSLISGLLARLEGKRFGELNRNATHESADLFNAADITGSNVTFHIEAVIRP
jgi:hypothetical protein